MRVISGEKRRFVLKTPKGTKIRPTSDMIKETLFNIINNDLIQCVFADVFSGTGQIGIEALSRGANHCIFIDKDKSAINLIQENIEHVDYLDKSSIIQGIVPGVIRRLEKYQPDIIFMDPPYEGELYKDAFDAIKELEYLNNDVLIITEAERGYDFSFLEDIGFYIEREKVYKTNKHVFIRKYE